ncbi:MAG: hypothetical protein ACRDGM_18220, partial [bacterium]
RLAIDEMTLRAPYFDMRSGLWIPTVVTWDYETGLFARVEGPRGFKNVARGGGSGAVPQTGGR